jgi:predicted RNase H-like nuclease (RuvC/YqgF family)
MRLVLEDLLRLVGGALGEDDITEIIQKIESFESQMLIAEEMTEKFTALENLMKDRETEIEKLHELVKSERLKKEELEKESIEKVKKIEDLENGITRLESELKSYVEQIESGVMVSDSRIEELEITIEEKNHTLQEKEKELEFLKMEMHEKGIEIKTKPRPRPSSLRFEWFPVLSMTKRKN